MVRKRTWPVMPAYTNMHKRPEHKGQKMIWSISARASLYEKHGKEISIGQAKRKIEYAKSQIRAKVEHQFRVIKHQFGYTQGAFSWPSEKHCQQVTLFVLSILMMVRKQLMIARELRP